MGRRHTRLIIVLFIICIFIGTSIAPAFSIDLKDNITDLIKTDFKEDILIAMDRAKMVSLSAGIIINNSLVWHDGYGYYKNYYNPLIPDSKKIPTKDTIYMAASISKSITATAILQLYEKKLIDIDDNISKYLDFEFKNPFFQM